MHLVSFCLIKTCLAWFLILKYFNWNIQTFFVIMHISKNEKSIKQRGRKKSTSIQFFFYPKCQSQTHQNHQSSRLWLNARCEFCQQLNLGPPVTGDEIANSLTHKHPGDPEEMKECVCKHYS